MPIEYQQRDYFPDTASAAAVFRRRRAGAVLPHYHYFDEIVFIVSGRGLHVVDGATMAFHAGDILLIPAGCRHHYRHVHNLSIACLLLHPERMSCMSVRDAYEACPGLPRGQPMHVRPTERLFTAILAWFDGIEQLKWPHCKMELSLIFRALAASDTIKLSVSSKSRIQIEVAHTLADGLHHLESHFAASDALAPLCDLVKMSSRTLLRRFHEFAGRSPIHYLADLRMHHAMLELRRSQRSVLDISLDSGFNDLSYFHRRFHKVTGSTPRTWRSHPAHVW